MKLAVVAPYTNELTLMKSNLSVPYTNEMKLVVVVQV